MKVNLFRNRITTVLCGLVVIGLASILGVLAGNMVESFKRQAQREEATQGILEHMQSINVGDTIPDYQFENLDNQQVRLSELISERTVLVFFDPYCHHCLVQLDSMELALGDSWAGEYIILISAAKLQDLQAVRDERNIRSWILWDRGDAYADMLNVFTKPFNIAIDADMVIHDIVAGPLTVSDIQRLVKQM